MFSRRSGPVQSSNPKLEPVRTMYQCRPMSPCRPMYQCRLMSSCRPMYQWRPMYQSCPMYQSDQCTSGDRCTSGNRCTLSNEEYIILVATHTNTRVQVLQFIQKKLSGRNFLDLNPAHAQWNQLSHISQEIQLSFLDLVMRGQ